MLMDRGNGTKGAGPADIICILKLPAGTYHVAFLEENPLPGPIQPIAELPAIRLKSKMHQTIGAPTLEEAQGHLKKLREKIIVNDTNVVSDVALEVNDPVMNLMVTNWTKESLHVTLKDALGLTPSPAEAAVAEQK